jgi:hypothetical protein
VQYDPQNKCLELVFTEQQKQEQFLPNKIGGRDLTEQQKQDFAAGKTIFVTDLVGSSGKRYHTYVTKDLKTQKWNYVNIATNAKQSYRYQACEAIANQHLRNNPLSKQQQSELDAGRMVIVDGMVDKQGQPFAAYVVKDVKANTLNYASFKNVDQQQQVVTPTPEHKTQVAANNDGHKPEALKNVKGAVERKQPSTPTAKQASQIKQNDKRQKSTKKKVGMKM